MKTSLSWILFVARCRLFVLGAREPPIVGLSRSLLSYDICCLCGFSIQFFRA